MSEEQPRVLCVDDEPRVLQGLESNLAWEYDVRVAASGPEGLEVAQHDGPFAVVISDMRMPGMDGAAFLANMRERAPDTTRILLTGYSDMDAALAAVNKGNIFRFLNKPCGPDVLLEAVEAAAEQHRLVRAERELLEKTLGGAIKVLTDVLSLVAPVAFNRASCVKGYVGHIAARLEIPDPWQYELAAMLSPLGCITVPPETLGRAYAGQELTSSELEMLRAHPVVARDLLAQVPRLELVAEMVRGQGASPQARVTTSPTTRVGRILLGASLLRLGLAVDRIVIRGESVKSAVANLRRSKAGHPAELLDALEDYCISERGEAVRAVRVSELQTFMVLDEDVRSKNGTVVVPKGRQVDRMLVERLKNFAAGVGLVEPFRVRFPDG